MIARRWTPPGSPECHFPAANSIQPGMAPHQPGDGEHGRGAGIKRSARVNSDSYLGREFGREVRGTTAVILQGKRKDTF